MYLKIGITKDIYYNVILIYKKNSTEDKKILVKKDSIT